jgi:hypothetical protein
MIANVQSKIQIVDTHESLETLVNIDVPVGTNQFNRTLVRPRYLFSISHMDLRPPNFEPCALEPSQNNQ